MTVGDLTVVRDEALLELKASNQFKLTRLGSGVRLGARGTQRQTYQLRLALEPECLGNLTATAREIPRDGAEALRDTQAVCDFRCWASKHAPLFHTINTIVAIFLARVSRAISGRMPLAKNSA
jgi:hypothetical protein